VVGEIQGKLRVEPLTSGHDRSGFESGVVPLDRYFRVVDAKDGSSRRFYEREGFLPFPDQPMKLFGPIADIRRLFE
jgi:hypothetical protein